MAQPREVTALSPISCPVSVARLPQKGMPLTLVATEEQRRRLAEAHELLAVDRLRAEMLVIAWKRNGVRVSGKVEADIVQECIVTLEPLTNHIAEEFEQLYLPADSKLGRLGFETGGEILLDVEGDDSPETFHGDTIDVGALAEEFFGLAIDPYPRKPGAELPQATDAAEGDQPSGPLQEKLASLLRKT